MLVAACVLITAETPFPGIAAALPVVGTAMLLLAGSVAATPGKRTLAARVLATRADADASATGPTRSTSGTGRC